MTRIAIHDEPKPFGETLAHALLRALVGGLVMLHGILGMMRLGGAGVLSGADFWQGWVTTFSLGNPHTTSVLRMAFELLAGFGLIVGFWTRACTVLIAILAAQALAGLAVRHGWSLAQLAALEAPALLVGMSAYLLRMGPGALSVDHALRERARRRAIQKDELWLHPPYVSRDEPVHRP